MVSYSTDAYRWQYLVDRYGNQKVCGTIEISLKRLPTEAFEFDKLHR
jgi:hypothetical protein